MSKLTGKELFQFCLSKVGTDYFYGSKMQILTEPFMTRMHRQYPSIVTTAYIVLARARKQVGKVNVDCSGLPGAYTKKMLGSAQLYSNAYTRLNPKEYEKWANGVIVWRQGHVGVFGWYKGKPVVVEAKGIRYGTVISDFKASQWTCGLTFSWLEYFYNENVSEKTWKKENPYIEPKVVVTSVKQAKKKGCKTFTYSGNDARWLQYELIEAGYNIELDGVVGKQTTDALIKFQESSKITADGLCGQVTRRALKAV